jgi:electron transport complex, RnfABCDGE type, G subunit
MAVKSNLINMAVCLSAVCLVCAGLLGGVYAVTAEPIAKTNAETLKASIAAVLPAGGELSEAKDIEVGGQPSKYYVSTNGGEVVAYAVKSSVVGFGGPLELMVGVTPDGQVYNTSVLTHNETPGLGAKCTTDTHFMEQFQGFDTNAKSLSVKKDGGDVDAITASTITSRAYTLAIRNAVEAIAKVKGE